MKYENIKFAVGTKEYDVIHCLGERQCTCSSCGHRSWTSWFYKLNENDTGVLCRNCLQELLIQRRIVNAQKELISTYHDAINNAVDNMKWFNGIGVKKENTKIAEQLSNSDLVTTGYQKGFFEGKRETAIKLLREFTVLLAALKVGPLMIDKPLSEKPISSGAYLAALETIKNLMKEYNIEISELAE